MKKDDEKITVTWEDRLKAMLQFWYIGLNPLAYLQTTDLVGRHRVSSHKDIPLVNTHHNHRPCIQPVDCIRNLYEWLTQELLVTTVITHHRHRQRHHILLVGHHIQVDRHILLVDRHILPVDRCTLPVDHHTLLVGHYTHRPHRLIEERSIQALVNKNSCNIPAPPVGPPPLALAMLTLMRLSRVRRRVTMSYLRLM